MLRNIIVALLLSSATISGAAYAATQITLLSAATATGTGDGVEVPNRSKHSVQVTITGGPTTVVVAFEGSLDGSTWAAYATHTMSAAELAASAAIFSVVNKPAGWVRANVTTLSGGTSPTVTVKHIAE